MAPAAAPAPKPKRTVVKSDDYYWIRNIHKRPMVGGPTAGWDLVVRKADGCLLEIFGGRHPPDPPVNQERKLGKRTRFQHGPETTKQVSERLKQHGLKPGAIARIVGRMHRCPLGFRDLVFKDR